MLIFNNVYEKHMIKSVTPGAVLHWTAPSVTLFIICFFFFFFNSYILHKTKDHEHFWYPPPPLSPKKKIFAPASPLIK